jgi:cell division protein FtsQ
MRINWPVIKTLVAIVLVGVLYGFGTTRNSHRNLRGLEVRFNDQNPPFISMDAVNKMLIQNIDSVTSIVKETLVLKEVEKRLQENAMIRNAEVFVTVDGILTAEIEQRNPVARVSGSPDYYLDQDGGRMPLSDIYTERVPIISGSFSDSLAVAKLLRRIDNDEFMKRSVIGLDIQTGDKIDLLLRGVDLKVRFGRPKDINRKFRNFKTFYTKALQDSLAKKYQYVDLRFGNQVVATKR